MYKMQKKKKEFRGTYLIWVKTRCGDMHIATDDISIFEQVASELLFGLGWNETIFFPIVFTILIERCYNSTFEKKISFRILLGFFCSSVSHL